MGKHQSYGNTGLPKTNRLRPDLITQQDGGDLFQSVYN